MVGVNSSVVFTQKFQNVVHLDVSFSFLRVSHSYKWNQKLGTKRNIDAEAFVTPDFFILVENLVNESRSEKLSRLFFI